MPKIALTQAAAERLVLPPAGAPAIVYWDRALPGFGIRASSKGRKTFIAQYRIRGGREVLETLGIMSLQPSVAEARERARASMVLARQGIDPVLQRQQEQAAEEAASAAKAFTFAALVEKYLSEYASLNTRLTTQYETARTLRKAAAHFGDVPVSKITKADISQLVYARKQGAVGTAGLSGATNTLIIVRRALRWAVQHDLLERDPSEGIPKPLAKQASRDRVLGDHEIVAFFRACETLGWPFGHIFRLLILTAQREAEVAGMRWSEINTEQRVWSLPANRTKNGRAHLVHLSDQSLEIITSVPRIAAAPGKDFLFSVTGRAPVTGFHFAKAKVAEAMGVEDWVLHDARRTATTLMARLGVAPHVADRVLNHISGGQISSVAAVYNRFEYLDARKEALETLGAFIANLVRSDKVVALRG